MYTRVEHSSTLKNKPFLSSKIDFGGRQLFIRLAGKEKSFASGDRLSGRRSDLSSGHICFLQHNFHLSVLKQLRFPTFMS